MLCMSEIELIIICEWLLAEEDQIDDLVDQFHAAVLPYRVY